MQTLKRKTLKKDNLVVRVSLEKVMGFLEIAVYKRIESPQGKIELVLAYGSPDLETAKVNFQETLDWAKRRLSENLL